MKYFKGAEIITETEVKKGYILAVDSEFVQLIPEEEFNPNESDAEIINAEGLYIAPGLINMHIHGSGGKDTMNGTAEAYNTISSIEAKNGVTGFLATTMTMDMKTVTYVLGKIRESMKEGTPGAQLLGAHLEGPFISEKYKGAQALEHIIPPNWDIIEPYKDVIKLVTLAPEVEGAKELVAKLKENGIIASMGHTSATYAEAMEGVEVGITHTTHLFNAMSGVHHRNPGTAVAALSSDVYVELIPDTIHVHAGLFEMIRKAKGTDRVTLVTDCLEAGGMPDGNYELGGQPIVLKDNICRLLDGTIAGSVIGLNKGVYNFYKNTNAQLHEVFRMASLNPARELGIDDRKGSIKVGKDADFSLMDKDFNVKATYIKGKCVYQA